MGVVEQYLVQLNSEKRRFRRIVAALTALSLLIAFATVWNLRRTGVAIANDATCGYTEHRHSEECFRSDTLICEKVEHLHSISCYSDPKADVETAEDWEATLPNQYYARWADNLALIARSQIGYTESERNYSLADDGITKQGITRYGQWYGNPYGDWSAMFVAFCLDYAGIPRELIPISSGVYVMLRRLEERGIFLSPDENVGKIGNILFLDADENTKADKILIVTASSSQQILAVGGDWENAVSEVILPIDDPRIVGYVNIDSRQPELSLDSVDVMLESSGSTDIIGSFLTTTDKNSWQIVSGGYLGREEIHKIGNENVLVQKNVVPTAVENEFLVYLSIDKKLSWNTVFEYGTYYASAANGSVGEITSLSQGNPSQLFVNPTGSASSSFYMVIQIWNDSKTQLLSESGVITRYSNKGMKNGKILLQIPDSSQAIVVANVKDYQGTSASNPVYIQMTESMMTSNGGSGFERISVIDTVLESVVDTMGDNIEFVGVLAGDYTDLPTFENGVLTWHPNHLEMLVASEDSGEEWQRNAAQLVYKIRLKNDKSCLECLNTSCSISNCDHVYPTNRSATLIYHFSDDPNTSLRMNFQVPYVRGLLYDIHFTKIDEDFGFAIKGAVFSLTKYNDNSFTPIEIISDENGRVSFENLLPGTYTLSEIAAPRPYDITFGDTQNSMRITLNYTDNPDLLLYDTYGSSHSDKFMYKGASDGNWKVTNKNTGKLVELPATGGRGNQIYIFCGILFMIIPLIYGLSLRHKRERRSSG